jgi:hypothetical protein
MAPPTELNTTPETDAAAIEPDYNKDDYVAHDEPAAEVNNFPPAGSFETPQALNLADYDAMEAFTNLLPSTWDKADALGRARDIVALREAAKHDTAQAQLEAIERYHCAQTGEPYDDEPVEPPDMPPPDAPPQPEQEMLDGFDSVMRMATELSAKDLPVIDQFIGYVAGLRFSAVQEGLIIAAAAKRLDIRKPVLQADLKKSKKLARAYQVPRLPAGDAWKAELILDERRDAKSRHGERRSRGGKAPGVHARLCGQRLYLLRHIDGAAALGGGSRLRAAPNNRRRHPGGDRLDSTERRCLGAIAHRARRHPRRRQQGALPPGAGLSQ